MKVAVSKLPALDYYVWGSHILIRDSAPRFRWNFATRRYLVQERRISQLKHPCTLSRLWVNWEEIDWKSHETSAFYIHRWIPQKSLFAVFQTSESISCWLKPKVHDFHDWRIVWRVFQSEHENNRLVADLRESDPFQASKQCGKWPRNLNFTRLLAAYIFWARMFQLKFVSVVLDSLSTHKDTLES